MTPPHPRELATAGVGLAALLWLAALAGWRPLMLPDEGRYVGVAWEMLRSGDWLTPTLNGLPYFHKPPLFYWITAASMSLFGPAEWAARAAPLIGSLAAAMAVFVFVRRWCSERAALLSVIVLLAQPLFYLGGQFANLDALVAGCITVTTVSLAHAALCLHLGRLDRRALLVAYTAAALGVLAKGLIGAVIPALVIAAWLLMLRRWRTLLALCWWPGLALFALVAAPWFVAMQLRYADFLQYFFVVQHFKRYAAGGFNNVQPFWFYPALLLAFALPWLRWLRTHADLERLLEPVRGDVRVLMLVWVALVVLFFSLPRSKLIGYILPALPPLAVLLADGFESRGQEPALATRGWWAGTGAAAAIGVAIVVALAWHPMRSTKELGIELRAQRAPDEPVYMLDEYFFDVPLYARLNAPVGVVFDRHGLDTTRRDNWRKELADAATFARHDTRSLLQPDQLESALCAHAVSWVIGPSAAAAGRPFLARAHAAAARGGATVWRVDTTDAATMHALHCAGTPNSG